MSQKAAGIFSALAFKISFLFIIFSQKYGKTLFLQKYGKTLFSHQSRNLAVISTLF